MIESLTALPKVQDMEAVEKEFRPDVPFYPPTDVPQEMWESGKDLLNSDASILWTNHIIFGMTILFPERRQELYTIHKETSGNWKHLWDKFVETGKMADTYSIAAARLIDPYFMKRVSGIENFDERVKSQASFGFPESFLHAKIIAPNIVFDDKHEADLSTALSRVANRRYQEISYFYNGLAYFKALKIKDVEPLIETVDIAKYLEILDSAIYRGAHSYWYNALGLAILSAQSVEFGDFGMRLIWPSAETNTSVQYMPAERSIS